MPEAGCFFRPHAKKGPHSSLSTISPTSDRSKWESLLCIQLLPRGRELSRQAAGKRSCDALTAAGGNTAKIWYDVKESSAGTKLVLICSKSNKSAQIKHMNSPNCKGGRSNGVFALDLKWVPAFGRQSPSTDLALPVSHALGTCTARW